MKRINTGNSAGMINSGISRKRRIRKPGQGAGVASVVHPESVDDDFTGTNGDQPNTELWTNKTTPTIQDNKLHIVATPDNEGVTSKYLLQGDYDVEVDAEILSADGTSYTNLSVGGVTLSFASITGGAGRRIESALDVWSSVNVTVAPYSLRIKRVGTTATLYYKLESSGTWIEWKSGTVSADDASTRLYVNDGAAINNTSTFDNFILNSGTVVWP